MTKIIAVHIVLFTLMLGCSSNEKVIHDNRKVITDATKWNAEFIPNDTCSGIKLEFVPQKPKQSEISPGEGVINKTRLISIAPIHRNKLVSVSIKLWAYPLDTVVQIKTQDDYMFSIPSSERVVLTTIYYEIKNDPIIMRSKIDSGKAVFFKVPSGTYFMECSPSMNYVSRLIKDLIVIPNSWSIARVDTVPEPFFLY